MVDKYGVGQDPYCYPGTSVLRNRLGLTSDEALNEAERTLSAIAASEIEFIPPPYDLASLKRIHHQLFQDIYDWAGELRPDETQSPTKRAFQLSSNLAEPYLSRESA